MASPALFRVFPGSISASVDSTRFSASIGSRGRRRKDLRHSLRCPAGENIGSGGIEAVSVTDEDQLGLKKYLVREYGWGVRRMGKLAGELKEVARIQAEAFHEPSPLFDDIFFQFFEADVLQALIYRMRSSPPDRYACLVAEPTDASNLASTSVQGIAGVVDVSIQRDADVLKHLEAVDEYFYVSGIAVLKSFRRRRVASALLKACDAQSILWACSHLVLHAYGDNKAAQELYSKAGYEVVSEDAWWVNPWVGKRRRVLMIKKSSLWDWC